MPSSPQLMPAFRRNSKEAATVFRLIAGYGELEFKLAECLGHAIDDSDGALLAVFRNRGVRARIDMTEALTRKFFRTIGYETHLKDTLTAMGWCLSTRNLFAHCHWADWSKDPGLYYVNLNDGADGDTHEMTYMWLHTDSQLLGDAETYFIYTRGCLSFLSETAKYHREGLNAPLTHVQWPEKRDAPTRHNNPEEHVPPWPTSILKPLDAKRNEKPKPAKSDAGLSKTERKQLRRLRAISEMMRRRAKSA